MQKSFNSSGVGACDLKKKKTTEGKLFEILKKNAQFDALKKILELASEFDQDIYICLHDKKTKSVSHFSSDTKSFGLDNVTKLLKTQKKKSLQSLESFNEKIIEQTPISEHDINESTHDSKKNTTASSTEQKSEISGQPFDLMESEGLERYPGCQSFDTYNVQNQNMFRMSGGEQSLNTLFVNHHQSLSDIDITNEQSLPNVMCKSTSLFPINDFSNDSQEDSEENFDDEEVDNLLLSQKVHHARSCHDEDFGLRVNSKRGEFAQRYLFKSGFRNSHSSQEKEVLIQNESTFSDKEGSYYSDEQTYAEGSFNNLNGPALSSSNLPVATASKQLEFIPEQFEDDEDTTEEVQKAAIQNNDMFFSCCDWEALRNADKHQESEDTYLNENFSDSDDEILGKIHSQGSQENSPLAVKEAKHKAKACRKFPSAQLGNETVSDKTDAFDVDLVMKRVLSPNDTERIVSTKRYFSKSKRHHTSKKSSCGNHPKKLSGVSDLSKLSGTKEISKDIAACLSPMGASQRKLSFSDFQTNSTTH